MGRKLLFIYNPFSGKKLIKGKLYDIVGILSDAGYEITIHPTRARMDASLVVEETAHEYDRIVCSGGDGTLDEVVSGLRKSNANIPIGYIPAGSTNDFGNTLGIPKNMLRAATIAVGDNVFDCDLGRLNDKSFVYVAAFGLFTDTSYNTPQELKNNLGHFAYILEGAKTLKDVTSYNMRLECDECVIEDRFIFGMITNSASVGGFKGITGSHVDLSDGLFEVTLIKSPRNPIELNKILTSLTTRKMDPESIVTFKTSKMKIQFDSNVSWTIDGEFGGEYSTVEVENIKHGFRILRK